MIDATTQPGFAGTPVVQLDGTGAGRANGLLITSTGSTVRGLSITNFARDGIRLQEGGDNTITQNYLGLGARRDGGGQCQWRATAAFAG